MKKLFKVPCVWMEMGYLHILADNEEAAKRFAIEHANEYPLPKGHYLEDSFEIDEEGEPIPVTDLEYEIEQNGMDHRLAVISMLPNQQLISLLSAAERNQVYREEELHYRMMDARRHLLDCIAMDLELEFDYNPDLENGVDYESEEFKLMNWHYEMAVQHSLQNAISLDRNDSVLHYLVDAYEDQMDCNDAENDTWETVVREHLGDAWEEACATTLFVLFAREHSLMEQLSGIDTEDALWEYAFKRITKEEDADELEEWLQTLLDETDDEDEEEKAEYFMDWIS